MLALEKKAKRKILLPGYRAAVKGCSCEESHYTAGHCGELSLCEGYIVAVAGLKVAMGEDGKALL